MPQVPSNLIPTTITQLPELATASSNNLVMVAYEGRTYKMTAGNFLGGLAGTVTSVSADSPLSVTSPTTAPVVSIAQATSSSSGYLSSTDWSAFNGKVSSVTSSDGSVTVTGTTSVDLSVAVAASTTNVLCQVRNATGATLAKGTVVYITGATGQIPTVSKALATSDATSAQTLGLMTADLANNSNGFVTIIGLVTDVDTSAYTDGAQLYLSGSVAGGMTSTKPSAPTHLVYVAVVEYAHPIHGKLFVKVQNGYELDEIHDVQIVSPTNQQVLMYNSATSLWKNQTIPMLAINGGKTANTSITNTATYTTGGVTLASQTAAAGSVWRVRAYGQFTAVSNATARTAEVACFWDGTQLAAITPTVLASTAQTTQWDVEFTLTASSTTAIWVAGKLLNRINSISALALDNVTPASATVTAGAQTIDLRFRVSSAVAAEGWVVQSVTIERLV